MKSGMYVVLCAICAALAATTCEGANTFVTVPDGATVAINGANDTSFTVNGVTWKNITGNILVAAGDATISVTYSSGKTSGGLYCGLVATNGTVTLDLTAVAGCSFALINGANVKGEGVLRVKGRDSLCLGGGTADAAPAAAVNLEYVDATDVPYANPEGLILTNRFLEWSLPVTTPWHMAADAEPVIINKGSAIAASMLENGVMTLANRKMRVFKSEALPTAPVAIGDGGTMTIVPRGVTESDYFSQAGGAGTITNAFDIAAGGELNLSGRNTINMKGAISGSGTIRFTSTKEDNGGTTTLEKGGSFTGAVICDTAGNTLVFKSASPGAGGNDVTMIEGASLRLDAPSAGYSGSIGTLTGPATGSATLTLSDSKAGTLTIASRTGNVTINGAGYDKTTVTLGSLAVGDMLLVEGGSVRYGLSAAAQSASGVFTLTRTNGRNVYMRSANATELDFFDFAVPSTGSYTLAAEDGVTYQNVPDNVCLEVAAGVSATLDVWTNAETRVRMDGGSLDVSRYMPKFASKVQFWMDPSDCDSVVSSSERTLSRISYPVVAGMNDTRVEQTSVKLTYTKDVESTWPTLITNGVNGLDYLSFDPSGNRRLKFGSSSGISTKFAIMVFGSQNGGGKAIIGNTSGYYCRGGTLAQDMSAANPIFANGDIATWVNGESVDPSNRNLSGGWEIISFDTSGANVYGLGFNGGYDTTTNTRGQNYGEVLLFSKTPTDGERIAAEKYLAAKWGLLGDYHAAEETAFAIRAEGTGSITLSTPVALSGSFSGTVNMNGKELSVAADPLPPGEEAVVSEGRLAWFDPDKADFISRNSREVLNMFDVGAGKTDGAPVLNSSGRTPKVSVGARGFGPSRTWVDYRDASYYGRTLRLNRYPTTSGSSIVALSARTVFLVQDSSKGGGSPFLSAVNGTGNILSRLTNYDDMAPDAGLPVWRGTTANFFTSGATYLDGHEIDGAVEGFQGRPELLTAVGGSSFTLGAFAYYGYLNSYYNKESAPTVDAGEIQGEIIVYGDVLGESARKGVEAYLMWKWLGLARDGYSVMTNLTVTGGGTLTVASLSQMPKTDASFVGTLALSETAFPFTVTSGGEVEGTLTCGGTLAFAPSCTANVTIESGAPVGAYTLASGGAIASGTEWTLNLVGGSNRNVSLEVRGDALILNVVGKGMMFTLR